MRAYGSKGAWVNGYEGERVQACTGERVPSGTR